MVGRQFMTAVMLSMSSLVESSRGMPSGIKSFAWVIFRPERHACPWLVRHSQSSSCSLVDRVTDLKDVIQYYMRLRMSCLDSVTALH